MSIQGWEQGINMIYRRSFRAGAQLHMMTGLSVIEYPVGNYLIRPGKGC